MATGVEKLTQALERTIEKLESDPGYVEQARQIQKAAHRIISANALKVKHATLRGEAPDVSFLK